MDAVRHDLPCRRSMRAFPVDALTVLGSLIGSYAPELG
jgi:hypothetical protein